MRVLNLLPLLPFALAAPTKQTIPELSVSDWHSIQSGFQDGLRSLSSWSVSKAEEMIDRFEEVEAAKDDSLTIWGQLKADPNSFSKLVKVIEVSRSDRAMRERELTGSSLRRRRSSISTITSSSSPSSYVLPISRKSS